MRPSRILHVLSTVMAFLIPLWSTDVAAAVFIEISKGQVVRLSRPATTVFVADPSVADIQVKSPTLIYVFGKAIGETTLIAADEEEKILLETPVRVSHNLGRLREMLRTLVPNGSVTASTVGNAVVLEGTVANPQEAEEARRLASGVAGGSEHVINRLRVSAPTQINLRVRVAEMSRAVTKQLGFRFTATGAPGGVGISVATANPFVGTATGMLGLSGSIGTFDINGVIDAMEEDQLIRVLAEPNLTALSGETASFLAGGEFPIVAETDEDQVSITFKQFGVSLAFTPTVLNDGRINLHVRPEVSQLTSTGSIEISGFSIPGLSTRRAETTIELASGQSFAIAGLLRQDADQSVAKFPGLGDIPILGALFRSTQFQRSESELVIIVTPYAVMPADRQRLAGPTDGVLPPHDFERLMFGAHWRSQNPRSGLASGLVGPVGFELQ